MKEHTSASDESTLLDAAKNGAIEVIKQYPPSTLRSITDSSGCTLLHWSAGNGHLDTLRYLLSFFDPDTPVKSKKAIGRSPLHYACRNGHLPIVQMLIEEYNANFNIRAKHGVTPFQLAIWQNQLHVCKYLTNNCGVMPKEEMNDFGCGIIHWLGIVPTSRSAGIIDLAQWIIEDHGVDVFSKQNQGHTVLHKASWGGHLDLVTYLHEVHGMYDDVIDHAGNYAADLCDMANTEKHSKIATYLRRECSLEYKESCNILGVNADMGKDEIRKAYLEKARQCHPDRINLDASERVDNGEFQRLKKAYDHLMRGGIATKQKNPAHSIKLLLKLHGDNNDHQGYINGGCENEEINLFKTRLIAVLLEYGDKGVDLSNIPKKWKQVWPDVTFPDVTDNEQANNRKRKKGQLLRFIQEHAGDVITVTRQGDKGSVLISAKSISRSDVLHLANERRNVAQEVPTIITESKS